MIGALLTLLAVAERPVVVSSITTPQLIAQCHGKDDDPDLSFCTGYIIAAFDSLSLAHQICPSPDSASTVDAVASVRRYLRKRGGKTTAAPAFVVRDALQTRFPCRPVKPARPAKRVKRGR